MNKQQQAIHRMRRRALEINRAFRRMRPLFVGAQRLSLNAEVTSCVVGEAGEGLIVVMRELRTMTEHLRNMIADIEDVSGRISNRMASSMSAETKQHYYRLTLDLIREGHGKAAVQWPDTIQGQCPRPSDLNGTESLLWSGISQSNDLITGSMTALAGISQELLILLNRSGWVAVRQSEYLAVLAAVESSRWTDRRESVEAIVESMREIAKELRTIQNEAGEQVNGLILEIKNVQGTTQNQAA
ncbi:MAG: hypothetical protein P1V35_02515 [Planctomycetota bacterium]|nr:hypothetical protein [Planctomycetota bacterium]